MAPLQYRAGNGGAQNNGANNVANAVPNGADNDSMMNPFAKPWTPQADRTLEVMGHLTGAVFECECSGTAD